MQLTLDIPEKFFAYQTPKELIRLLNQTLRLYEAPAFFIHAEGKFRINGFAMDIPQQLVQLRVELIPALPVFS